MKKYEVTIGIPVFQSVDYIGNTLESALAQTFRSIEYLVIDDGADDGTMDIVKHYRQGHPRGQDIRILRNERNQGVGFSRNRIIEEACGQYLYFMDSDDVIEPNTIQRLYDALNQHRSQMAYASYDVIDGICQSSTQTYQKPLLHLKGEGLLAQFAYKHIHEFQITVCNFLIDVNVLRQSGVKFVDTRFWEDMAFTYELVTKITDAILLPDITYHYIHRSGSLSNYQHRELLDKQEVLTNISVLEYLKDRSTEHQGKDYLPDMIYNIEMNGFYLVCYVLKHYQHIMPCFTMQELRDVLRCPFSVKEILTFKTHVVSILFFWLLASAPIPLFRGVMLLVGKIKRAL